MLSYLPIQYIIQLFLMQVSRRTVPEWPPNALSIDRKRQTGDRPILAGISLQLVSAARGGRPIWDRMARGALQK